MQPSVTGSPREETQNGASSFDRELKVALIILFICLFGFMPMLILMGQIVDHMESRAFSDKNPVTDAFFLEGTTDLQRVLEAGADPNEIVDGQTILQSFLINIATWEFERPEYFKKIVMLVEHGYNVDEADAQGRTLLMLASFDTRWDDNTYDSFDMPSRLTELLIANSANINATDNMGRTALMWAVTYRGYTFDLEDKKGVVLENSPIVDELDYSDDFAMGMGFFKLTPIFYPDQIEALVNAGADLSIREKLGFTARDYFEFALKLIELSGDNAFDAEIYQSERYLDSVERIRVLLEVE